MFSERLLGTVYYLGGFWIGNNLTIPVPDSVYNALESHPAAGLAVEVVAGDLLDEGALQSCAQAL